MMPTAAAYDLVYNKTPAVTEKSDVKHGSSTAVHTLLGFLPPSGAPAPTAALPNAPGTALPFESTADSCTDWARDSCPLGS